MLSLQKVEFEKRLKNISKKMDESMDIENEDNEKYFNGLYEVQKELKEIIGE